MKACGLLIGASEQYYDHIASFCLYVSLPLLVTDLDAQSSLEELYPGLLVIHKSVAELPTYALTHFTTFVSCSPRPFLNQILGLTSELLNKPFMSFFLHHGNSDKGHASSLMEGMAHETHTFIYGTKMEEFLKEKNVFKQLQGVVSIGNFREKVFTHYKKHFERQLGYVKKKKTVFYAPTWEDAEHSCSFFDALETLLTTKDDRYALIIKPHPNTVAQHAVEMERLKGAVNNLDDVTLVTHFPPIYTLLNHADIYLGDYSSVGYDFLTYNRPMFFLNHNGRNPDTDKGLALFHCGDVIYKESFDAVFDIIEDPQIEKKHMRHKMYNHTFDAAPSRCTLLDSMKHLERSYI